MIELCTTCAFPDTGEPINHHLTPGSCDRVKIELEMQERANDLRRAWLRAVHPGLDMTTVMPWRELSRLNKDGWIAVLYRAEEIFLSD